jgi:hypothetical protein
VSVFVLALAISLLPSFWRVGDGSEYFALFYAWLEEGRPYVTVSSAVRFDQFAHSHANVMDSETLGQVFAALRVDGGQDYNHFWFYSLLAAMIAWAPALVGFDLSPLVAFAVLHGFLAAATCWVLVRLEGANGIWVAGTLLFASPALWFISKVHTEFFTVSLTVMAFAAAWRCHWLPAAFALAIASTQNPSIGIGAIFLTGLWIAVTPRVQMRAMDGALIVAVALMTALHPAYYYLRYGWLTPQVHVGGADFDTFDPSKALAVVFNPDIGLLANWPLCALVALSALVLAGRHWSAFLTGALHHRSFIAFTVVYVASCMFAHATGSNVNGGGTVHVSRYALWYICIFVAPTLIMAEAATKLWEQRRLRLLGFVGTVFLCGAIFNTVLFRPNQGETYTSPSPAAALVWRYLPGLYQPREEILLERSSSSEGIGLSIVHVVVSPDCRILMVRGDIDLSSFAVSQPYCITPLAYESLRAFLVDLSQDGDLADHAWSQLAKDGRVWHFINLTADDTRSLTR